MFFELHDILLHRLWKAARDRRAVLIRGFLANPEMSTEDYRRYNRGYTFWSKAVRVTREWYLNHKRSTKSFNWNSKFQYFVDLYKDGRDLFDVFVTKVRLVRSNAG